MTERKKVMEDFEGIAERLKEIRRERGEVVTGEIGIAGPSGNPTGPHAHLIGMCDYCKDNGTACQGFCYGC